MSFPSAKRSGSSGAKDRLKGKVATPSAEPPVVAPIRIGGKRKYESEPESEYEEAKDVTDALERESLDTNDVRWEEALGLARAKMGNIGPGPLFAFVVDLEFLQSLFLA